MLRAIQSGNRFHSFAGASAFVRRALPACALIAAMALLMRAELLMRSAPLAVALLGACMAAGIHPALPVAGCLIGMLRVPLRDAALLPAIGCTLVLLAELTLSFIPAARRWSRETRVSLEAGLAVLLPALFFAGGAVLPSMESLAAAAVAATAAPFLCAALDWRPDRRHLLAQEKLGGVILLGGCVAGLFALLPLAGEAAAGFATLFFAPAGTGAGVLAGLALALGGADLRAVAVLAACAFAAGSRLCGGRWQRALAFGLTALALCAADGNLERLAAFCAGAGICCLLPERFSERAAAMLSPPGIEDGNPDRIAREVSAGVKRRLVALSNAFADLEAGCGEHAQAPDEQQLICAMRERLCKGCGGYEECWAGADNRGARLLCRLIGEALERVDAPPGMRVLYSDGEIPPELRRNCRRGRMIPDRLGLLLRDFSEKRRAEIKRCETDALLAAHYAQAREILLHLAEGMNAPVSFCGMRMEQLRAALEAEGLGGCAVFASGAEGCAYRLSRAGEGPWNQEEVRRASRALARVCGGRFAARADGGDLCFSQSPALAMETAASCQSGAAGVPCGDSHAIRMLDGDRMAIMISDGMGMGAAAQSESETALRLMGDFLDAGMSVPIALEAVNRRLLMRSGDECFATLDLCVVDLNSGIAEMTKLGACRTLILRGREILPVEGGRLPLGIITGVQPNIRRVRLRAGDWLMMGSDGVMEAGEMLAAERMLRGGGDRTPAQMAEEMVRSAALWRSEGHPDDLTCVCARICSATERRARREACGG